MTITYTKLLNETLKVYSESGSLEAYQFVKKHADEVKGNRAQILNFQYSLAAASGLKEQALAHMKEAVIENGFWYSYDYLVNDEDLDSLREEEEFHEILELCKEREAKAKNLAKPELKVIQCSNREPAPLLMVMHGDQENIEMTELYWNSSALKDFTLALLQSSQIDFSNGYVWEDVEKGTKELSEHYEQIKETVSIDENAVIISGFSAGAQIGLNALLTGEIQAEGFIFVAPWLPELSEWEEAFERLRENNIKGYVICGNQDEDCFESSQQLVELLKEKHIPYQFKVIEGLDHDYPANFEALLDEALQFIES